MVNKLNKNLLFQIDPSEHLPMQIGAPATQLQLPENFLANWGRPTPTPPVDTRVYADVPEDTNLVSKALWAFTGTSGYRIRDQKLDLQLEIQGPTITPAWQTETRITFDGKNLITEHHASGIPGYTTGGINITGLDILNPSTRQVEVVHRPAGTIQPILPEPPQPLLGPGSLQVGDSIISWK